MALDKVLKIYDENGNPVDYDILASDVKFTPDGKDLPTKLAEMEEEIGEGGYTPPAGGIPKTDLAPSVQTSLGLADTALQSADKAQLQNAITSLQNALNTLIGSGNVQGAIDTFNEVKAFLDGIDTDDPTLFNQLKSLSDAITALQTTLSQKANDNAVVKSISVNGTAQQKDTNGNVNVVVPTMTLDDAPTAGSNNAVKSGGIKTAIDQVTPTIDANGKWVIGGVTTDKDAQGPRGNTVLVNENAVGIQGLIVNNVVDGGETDILSAEMGKVIRQNIMKIFNALGNYAFPEGKPILNWGSTVINHSINVNGVTGGLTISDVEVDGTSVGSLPAQVVEGKSLSLRLALPSNLYVFDDGVSVKMGGVDITSTAFSEATGEINIAEVTDDVVIVANAMTYALPSNLAFNLDCMNVGSNAGCWTDLIGGTKFKLTDVTINDSGAVFNGTTSKGVVMDDNDPTQPAALGSKYVDVAFDAGTIEVIAEADSGSLPTANNRTICPVFINPKDGGLIAAFRMGGSSTSYASCLLFMYTCISSGVVDDNLAFLYNGSTTFNSTTYTANGGNNIAISAHTNLTVDGIVRIDGITQQNMYWFDTWIGGPSQTRFAVGYYYRDNNGTITEKFFKGKIKAIRVYNTKLTEQQMIQNYKVDKKRFNLQ